MALFKRQPSVRPWLSPRPRLRLVQTVPFTYDRDTERYFIAPAGPYDTDSIWDTETEQGNYTIAPWIWSPSGLALTFDASGIPQIAGAYSGRQTFDYREWDVATYGLVPVDGGGTTSTYVIGNVAPVVGTVPTQEWSPGIDSYFDLPITSPYDALEDLDVTATLPLGTSIALHTYYPGEAGEYQAWRLEFSLATGLGTATDTISDLKVTDTFGAFSTFAAFTWNRTDAVVVPSTASGTLTYAAYSTLLLNAGLIPTAAAYVTSATITVGNVVETIPANPTLVALGSQVLVYVSAAASSADITETVPYLIGYTQAPAEAAIASLYCVSSVVSSGGTVASQSPAAFTQVDRGATIQITMGGTITSVSTQWRAAAPYNSGVQ